ncbi:hypothetical protein GW626_15040 [Peribacillus muralis]|uniref:hypothetical protein n=1 Tax=Peribacillus muralis TaxID=264697 RepID=UPI001F4E64B0|nr:hypothetical protein [Peribacillus muralis]MCK1991661.1 hypothetical protein [Peribacillus muralis]MCK2012220.1 hypothetical protein [Peribacillus muralis]
MLLKWGIFNANFSVMVTDAAYLGVSLVGFASEFWAFIREFGDFIRELRLFIREFGARRYF